MKTMALVIATFMLTRYAVSVDPDDTTDAATYPTIIEMLIGRGSYTEVSRDCSGRVMDITHVPYSEYAISATHNISVVKVGVTGGVTTATRTAIWFKAPEHIYEGSRKPGSPYPYVAPQIGLNTKYFGLDLGYLFDLSKQPEPSYNMPFEEGLQLGTPIGGLRVGRLDRTYGYANYGMNVPLSVGCGVAEVGLGFGSYTGGPRFCLGVGAIPDDGLMITGKGDIPVSKHVLLSLRGHVAPGEGFGYGLAGGLKFRF